MLKYWRLVLLLIFVFGSVLAVGLKYYPYGRNAVEIVYISADSPANGILEQGMMITEVDGSVIRNKDDWLERTQRASGTISLTANGKGYSFNLTGPLGISVMDIDRVNLDFGLDIKGGTRVILRPKTNATQTMISQVINTLETRANMYGLKEIKFYPVRGVEGDYYVQIEAAGIGGEIIDNLLSKQGSFEAKVLKRAMVSDSSATMQLGEEQIPISVLKDGIEIDGRGIYPNSTFDLRGIPFQYVNRTADGLVFLATVYTGKDIELVYSDPQKSGVIRSGDGYSFYFVVLISQEGAKRFADVTAGIPSVIDLNTGEEYLDSMIYLYLDNQLVSDLRIGSELGGKVYTTPQIQGFRTEREDAAKEKLNLQTILRSGALPTTLETLSVDVISPTLGYTFIQSAVYAGMLAAAAVFVIIFIRYRKIKIALPIIFIGFSEVIIILGVAAINDSSIWMTVLIINFILIAAAWWKKHEIDIYAWMGAILIPLLGLMSWSIDLSAIGGIIAAIGTGVNDQIIIVDESLAGRKREGSYNIREQIKRAFFIIFGAAATTIAAMVPLMSIGIGLVRGFAITTIVGILVGILITRPAYAKIVEAMIEKEK